MAGSNLTFTQSPQLWKEVEKVLKMHGGVGKVRGNKKLCFKAGAPVDDALDDNPSHGGITGDEVGTVLLDVTNSEVYVCSSYTNSTTHAWVKAPA